MAKIYNTHEESGKLGNTFGEWLNKVLGSTTTVLLESKGDLFIVTTKGELVNVLKFLRDNTQCQFKVLVDIVGVDYPQREQRFEVVYQLLSVHFGRRISVKVAVDSVEGLPSVTGLYKSANWFEREVWDMFGVFFHDHPDLRRIFTDYGFIGHPLRKDFPLTGYTEVRYDEEKKSVVCEPLEKAQNFRAFQLDNAWNTPVGAPKLGGEAKTFSEKELKIFIDITDFAFKEK